MMVLLKLVLISFMVVLVQISGHPKNSIDIGAYFLNSETNQHEITTRNDCTKEGPVCNGCDSSYNCIEIEDGIFIKTPDVPCDSGTTCMEATGTCRAGSNPKCGVDNIDNYECGMIGIYPDLKDCTRYFICAEKKPDTENTLVSKWESFSYQCPDEYYFNAKHGLCNRSNKNKCATPTVNCTEVGLMGAVNNTQNLYYICQKAEKNEAVIPIQLRCRNDLEYDSERKSCVSRTPESGMGSNGKCEKTGNFYDPSSCRHYLGCSRVGANPNRHVCPTNMKFHQHRRVCVDFTCEDIEY